MRTGENYFFFHFVITFITAEINSVSSGNMYSYAALQNVTYATLQWLFNILVHVVPSKLSLYNMFLDKATSLLDTN